MTVPRATSSSNARTVNETDTSHDFVFTAMLIDVSTVATIPARWMKSLNSERAMSSLQDGYNGGTRRLWGHSVDAPLSHESFPTATMAMSRFAGCTGNRDGEGGTPDHRRTADDTYDVL